MNFMKRREAKMSSKDRKNQGHGKPVRERRRFNFLDQEVMEVFTTAAEKRRRKPKPSSSAKFNKARLEHLMWRISCK